MIKKTILVISLVAALTSSVLAATGVKRNPHEVYIQNQSLNRIVIDYGFYTDNNAEIHAGQYSTEVAAISIKDFATMHSNSTLSFDVYRYYMNNDFSDQTCYVSLQEDSKGNVKVKTRTIRLLKGPVSCSWSQDAAGNITITTVDGRR